MKPSILFANCINEVKMMYKLHVLSSAPRVINIILSLNRIYMYTYTHIYMPKKLFHTEILFSSLSHKEFCYFVYIC